MANFYRSYVIKRLLIITFWMGAFTTVLAVVSQEWLPFTIKFNSGIFSLLGIVLSIVLVFRTNSAYDRWWEGRRQWGDLVNNSRNLSMLLQATLPATDVKGRRFFCAYISSYALALQEHLRDGVKPAELTGLSPEEQAGFAQVSHIPNQLLLRMYRQLTQTYRRGDLSDAELINVKTHLEALANITGACERIRKTPIPFSYSVFIKTFILVYCTLLPIGLLPDFGYFTIPIVMFVFYAFAGLEMMAQEIEEPFGLDCNDLPIGDIALNIGKNVQEILGMPEIKTPEVEDKLYAKVF